MLILSRSLQGKESDGHGPAGTDIRCILDRPVGDFVPQKAKGQTEQGDAVRAKG